MNLLLNPRVWVAVAVLGLLFFLYSDLKTKEIRVETLEGENASLALKNEDLGRQIVSLDKMVVTLKANLIAAKQSIKEMQVIKEEANDLRRKLIALQNQPTSCEELKVEYEKVAIDITGMFNNRVRGKVKRPDPAGDSPATEVLPNTSSSEISGSKINACPSGRLFDCRRVHIGA